MVAENTFEKLARGWHGAMRRQWQPQTARAVLKRLGLDIFGAFGNMAITEVKPRDVV